MWRFTGNIRHGSAGTSVSTRLQRRLHRQVEPNVEPNVEPLPDLPDWFTLMVHDSFYTVKSRKTTFIQTSTLRRSSFYRRNLVLTFSSSYDDDLIKILVHDPIFQ